MNGAGPPGQKESGSAKNRLQNSAFSLQVKVIYKGGAPSGDRSGGT